MNTNLCAIVFALVLVGGALDCPRARAAEIDLDDSDEVAQACSGDVSFEQALQRGRVAAQSGRNTESKCWLRKAGEQSDPSIKFKVARMYRDGNGGLPRDKAEAEFWLKWAASEKFPAAVGYIACSTTAGRVAMLDLARQCWNSLAKAAMREIPRTHCNEDQEIDSVQTVDVITRSNDPSIFRCKAIMKTHFYTVDPSRNDSAKPPECAVSNLLPVAYAAAELFDLLDNGSRRYTLVIHDPDEDAAIHACKGMSIDFTVKSEQ